MNIYLYIYITVTKVNVYIQAMAHLLVAPQHKEMFA